MADERITTIRTTEPADAPAQMAAPPASAPQTVVIERGGGGGGKLLGVAALLLVIVAGFFLYSRSRNESARTDAVSSAAEKVGDAVDKVVR